MKNIFAVLVVICLVIGCSVYFINEAQPARHFTPFTISMEAPTEAATIPEATAAATIETTIPAETEPTIATRQPTAAITPTLGTKPEVKPVETTIPTEPEETIEPTVEETIPETTVEETTNIQPLSIQIKRERVYVYGGYYPEAVCYVTDESGRSQYELRGWAASCDIDWCGYYLPISVCERTEGMIIEVYAFDGSGQATTRTYQVVQSSDGSYTIV